MINSFLLGAIILATNAAAILFLILVFMLVNGVMIVDFISRLDLCRIRNRVIGWIYVY